MIRIVKYVLVAALSFGVFALLHEIATAERGFEALGGELAAFLILFFIWMATSGKKSDSEGDFDELD